MVGGITPPPPYLVRVLLSAECSIRPGGTNFGRVCAACDFPVYAVFLVLHGVKGRLSASAPCLTISLIQDEDVCVKGADGANAASSAAVAHASASVSNTKKQLKLNSFSK